MLRLRPRVVPLRSLVCRETTFTVGGGLGRAFLSVSVCPSVCLSVLSNVAHVLGADVYMGCVPIATTSNGQYSVLVGKAKRPAASQRNVALRYLDITKVTDEERFS